MRPRFRFISRPHGGRGECRVPAAPAAPCAKVESTGVEATGTPESPGIPARNGFNGLFRALPGDRAFLSPSSCGVASTRLDAGVEASGPHDFAVRRAALSSLAPPASIASRPTSVTIAKRPSESGGMAADIEVIWVGREQENFCKWDWTAKIQLKLKQIFVFRRSGRRCGLRYRSSANARPATRRW